MANATEHVLATKGRMTVEVSEKRQNALPRLPIRAVGAAITTRDLVDEAS